AALSIVALAVAALGRTHISAAASQDSGQLVPTFNRDIAPLLFDRCGSCHHPGGSAPFSLLSYAAVRPHASLVAAVTKSRTMPPWKSEPGYGEFVDQHQLSDAEVERIQRWVSGGMPEGNPIDLPPTPKWSSDW